MEDNFTHLKYPIGKFIAQKDYNLVEIESFIETIRQLPEKLKAETAKLTELELVKTYRPNGWTIRQVVHHLSDSHLNALLRFKLALTEENPTIKPYNEAAFAELADYKLPINATLGVITGIHQHWVYLMSGMSPEDFERTYFHPEHQLSFNLYTALANYDWHCKHHLAHIKLAKGIV